MDLCFSLSSKNRRRNPKSDTHGLDLGKGGLPPFFRNWIQMFGVFNISRGDSFSLLLALSGVKGGGKKGHETCGSPSYTLDRFVLHVKNYSSSSSTFFGKLDHKSVCSLGVKAFACLVLLRVVVLHHCNLVLAYSRCGQKLVRRA